MSGSHRRAPNPAWALGDMYIKEVFLEEVVPELSLAGQMGVDQERRVERRFLKWASLAFSVPHSLGFLHHKPGP